MCTMARKLDPEWAAAEIDAFLQVTAQVVPDMGPGITYFGTVMRGPKTEAAARAHVVEKVLDRVLPDWKRERPTTDKEYEWLRDQASRGKAALQRQAKLALKLGDDAPEMDAANLHPWAWESGGFLLELRVSSSSRHASCPSGQRGGSGKVGPS